MKRLIKYYQQFNDDQFSSCGTQWTGFDGLYVDNAGPKELNEAAQKHGFELTNIIESMDTRMNYRDELLPLQLTHRVEIKRESVDHFGQTETKVYYLGFVTLPSDDVLPAKETMNNKLTDEELEIVTDREAYGIQQVISLDNEDHLLIDSWDAYHCLQLLGYDLEGYIDNELPGCTVFDDSVTQCSECGEWDFNDNGYVYNHRIVDCEVLGINCGCFRDHCLKNVENFVNDAKNAIEANIADQLVNEGKLEFIERFIGGMVDGRGGWYNGQPTREGNPETVLQELLEKNPDGQFVFSHDESGQFQTYFSVYELKD